jgi:hypothetical protein
MYWSVESANKVQGEIKMMHGRNEHRDFSYPWMSFSSLSTYLACPRRFKYHYVDLLDEVDSVQLKRGRMVHDIMNNFFDILDPEKLIVAVRRTKMGGDITDTYVFKMMFEQLISLIPVNEPLMLEKGEKEIVIQNLMSFCIMETKRLFFLKGENVELSSETLRNFWYPREREALVVDDENKLFGYIDRSVNNPDGTVDLVDYKSGGGDRLKKAPSQKEILQGRIYMYIYAKQNGIDPKTLTYYIVYTKVTRGKMPNILSIRYNKNAEVRLLAKAARIKRCIDSAMFERCVDVTVLNCKPLSTSNKVYTYKKVCSWCSYTLQCYGQGREQFVKWSSDQFINNAKLYNQPVV